MELGFFKDWNDSQSLYLMIVNRYYSTVQEFKFTFQNLKPNTYYEIHEFIDYTVENIFTDENGVKSFEDLIAPGNGRLYKITQL